MAKLPTYPDNENTLRHLIPDDLASPYFNGPPDAKDVRVTCKCNHTFRPPWSQRLKFEYHPLILNLDNGEKAVFAPAAVDVPCPSCGTQNTIHFPSSEINNGKIALYGDESYHADPDAKRFVYVYAFVGANQTGRALLQERMESFKIAVRPSVEPSSWRFHTYDLRSSKWRKKHNVTETGYEIDRKLEALASAVSETSEDRCVSVTVCSVLDKNKLFKDGRDPENGVRDMVLSTAIYSVTEGLTKQGFSPSFILESVDNSASPEYMDYFVERIGRSLFHDLGFLYAARTKQIGLPTTRQKACTVEMEYADLVAFWTNRFFFRRSIGKNSEIPTERFGHVWWGSFSPRNGFGMFPGIGFPWNTFFAKAA